MSGRSNRSDLPCHASLPAGFKISTDLAEDGFEPVESIRVEYLFPALGHKDQMDVKLKDGMFTVPNLA